VHSTEKNEGRAIAPATPPESRPSSARFVAENLPTAPFSAGPLCFGDIFA
jgi:hypothetical protein